MVIFDSQLPGTSADVWAEDERLKELPALSLVGFSEVIIVAAHPDDETLGAGGLMAEASMLGLPITVIVVTDGGGSHPRSPSISAVHLAVLRRLEVVNATELLAPLANLVFLDFEDGTLEENREQVLAEMKSVVERSHGSTLLVAPWRGDGHRDHRVLGELCADAVEGSAVTLIEYPIWMWHWATPSSEHTPWPRLTALHLDDRSIVAKRRGIALHRTQIAPLSADAGDEVVLNPLFLRNFDLDIEVFVTNERTVSPVMHPESISGEYFDQAYEKSPDPWGFETRWYEQRKRALTLAALPHARYGSAFEIGSSIGVLTEQLAERCDALLAVDVSPVAVERARARLEGVAGVTIEQMDLHGSFPSGTFDLIVLSEVGYYFSASDLDGLMHRIADSLADGGTLALCHWRHPVADYPISGDAVHSALRVIPHLHRTVHHVEKDFLLDIFSTDKRSVAEQTGLFT